MSHYLIQQIRQLPNVRVRTCSEVVGASGSDHLERLRIADRDSRHRGEGRDIVAVRVYRRRPLYRLAG